MALTHTSTGAPIHHQASPMHLNAVDWIALVLMIVGGINWGLVGVLNVDLVATLLGAGTAAARAVYALVGLSALYGIALAVKCARKV